MNFYLLLAFAFGAVTAATDAPIVRASVILSRADGAGSQIAKKETLAPRSAHRQADGPAGAPARTAVRFEAPLTGAATPRAPATA